MKKRFCEIEGALVPFNFHPPISERSESDREDGEEQKGEAAHPRRSPVRDKQ